MTSQEPQPATYALQVTASRGLIGAFLTGFRTPSEDDLPLFVNSIIRRNWSGQPIAGAADESVIITPAGLMAEFNPGKNAKLLYEAEAVEGRVSERLTVNGSRLKLRLLGAMAIEGDKEFNKRFNRKIGAQVLIKQLVLRSRMTDARTVAGNIEIFRTNETKLAE